ncbi:MAG: hypothetical protein WC341_14270, partial [Bacteroidales bacterium]
KKPKLPKGFIPPFHQGGGPFERNIYDKNHNGVGKVHDWASEQIAKCFVYALNEAYPPNKSKAVRARAKKALGGGE